MRFLYMLLQCTWGLPQTLLGAVLYCVHRKKTHFVYHGAFVTDWRRFAGISLGLFVFVGCDAQNIRSKFPVQQKDCQAMLIHEYGHTLQSLLLGPLYLFIIGIPSLIWGNLPYFHSLRTKKHIPYSRLYTEGWADHWGAKAMQYFSSRQFKI